ncbi:RES family NAD+ phosphorylase [Microvirga sp. Mcv34]|uniref:RES family NAD+ phosphorylase n=1 Tax=Microvirga sp. Mcv34 TaxID=2926016 RepID=UPI0021CA1A50|nr:RES family NAD+ phosphorylase [Microvirga sp. Mcv34]
MSDIGQLKTKRICFDCVGETYLEDLIANQGTHGQCDYCCQPGQTFSIAEMADRIETAFEQHYERTSEHPSDLEWMMQKDKELNYEWEREGFPTVYAISGAALIGEQPARDIQAVLADRYADWESMKIGDETEFDAGACYAEKGPNPREWQAQWFLFEEKLKTETRFFSRDAAATLEVIFKDISHLQTRDGRHVVVDAGPGTQHSAFYRARSFEADSDLQDALVYPEQRLGTPPSQRARDGRMNARGIAVFYGASDPTAAIAEVRPPVGSKVLVGQFEVIAPLRLLDLRALDRIRLSGSIFDPDYVRQLERVAFLAILGKRITVPVMPSDEPFEYLATQAVADFLATEADPPLDGIIYPSVQAGEDQYNVVLFHKAARVQPADTSKGAKISAQLYTTTEDGVEPDYTIIEELPEPIQASDSAKHQEGSSTPAADDTDLRNSTLRLQSDSLTVHHVKRVSIDTDPHEVSHLQWEPWKKGLDS